MDFVNYISSLSSDEAFSCGAFFVISILLFSSLIELPFAFRDWAAVRRRQHFCHLRFAGVLSKPCHFSRCPCVKACPYYQKFSFIDWIWTKIKKP